MPAGFVRRHAGCSGAAWNGFSGCAASRGDCGSVTSKTILCSSGKFSGSFSVGGNIRWTEVSVQIRWFSRRSLASSKAVLKHTHSRRCAQFQYVNTVRGSVWNARALAPLSGGNGGISAFEVHGSREVCSEARAASRSARSGPCQTGAEQCARAVAARQPLPMRHARYSALMFDSPFSFQISAFPLLV